ncbi:response regulator [Alkalitalea saponilacus]|uniref:Response regulator receiver domain-containing protein n=1 Tax=Alkalitalea saponilacus TaxID=889453 RepID=A0A1T5EB33_9BACT|nr:response regulator [Alkalitalea saponilacus]ASB49054.1 response regulator [Alkalitalea saponilacus]SKB81000.1 Response regulator receiver domain-containing protein [Alkalitalea saponilacus]
MKNLSLLLVEDNILNQKLIFLNLTKFGFSIDVANNGLEAVDKVIQQRYDLILMDLMMPVMDGFEATIKIREIEENKGIHTPIIGLTANTFDADREKCMSIGMDEYMSKPFDIEVFNTILSDLGIISN